MPRAMVGMTPRTEIMVVSPEVAAKWLVQNSGSQRRISDTTVQAYANEMKSGRWTLTHQGIAFNVVGELVDGQHRLTAIVIAGVAVKLMITTGIPLEYNSPIDNGYVRSISHLTGKSSRVTSCVRALWYLENGLPTGNIKFVVGIFEEVYARHAEHLETVLGIVTSARLAPVGVSAALAYALPVAQTKILTLARQLQDGEQLSKGDPAHTLRRWLVGDRRYSPREATLAGCGAARAFIEGRTLTRITAGHISGDEKDGYSNYAWLVGKRRALRLEGTPDTDLVPSTGRKE